MRQMPAQSQAKCEIAPLRGTVTEPATRSTRTAAICEKSYKTYKELRLCVVVIDNSTDSSMMPVVAPQARTPQAAQRASFDTRAG
jgi:hypothetical protein